MTVWDVHRAELYDTIRSDKKARSLRPCVYCGTPTRALSQVCCAHTDLIELDNDQSQFEYGATQPVPVDGEPVEGWLA